MLYARATRELRSSITSSLKQMVEALAKTPEKEKQEKAYMRVVGLASDEMSETDMWMMKDEAQR